MVPFFEQDKPSTDPIWTSIKTVTKCNLVLTPAWASGYNNSFTDLWPLPSFNLLVQFVLSRMQQFPRQYDGHPEIPAIP